MTTLTGKKIAVLGVGKIGEAIIRALVDRGGVLGPDISGTAAREESSERIARLGIRAAASNAEAVKGADIVLIAVKPTVVPQVCAEVGPALAKGALVVSVAASVTTRALEAALGAGVPVVRVMPNTPCLLGEGMSVLARGSVAKDEHLRLARALFDAVGRTAVLDEKLMDGVTGLSGSGPAYVYVVIESLAEAGVKVGIPRDVSTLLAA
ncbi:MAG: pyrroline-5-carboxylate reductase family protein, partial [Planctomycetota bacterium]